MMIRKFYAYTFVRASGERTWATFFKGRCIQSGHPNLKIAKDQAMQHHRKFF